MPFTFNFTFAVPNPFSAFSTNLDQIQPNSCSTVKPSLSAPTVTFNNLDTNPLQARLPLRRARRAPSPISSAPLAKKRGWRPSSSEPSYPSATSTSSSGYFDTPAKYRDMASNDSDNNDKRTNPQDQDEMEGGTSVSFRSSVSFSSPISFQNPMGVCNEARGGNH